MFRSFFGLGLILFLLSMAPLGLVGQETAGSGQAPQVSNNQNSNQPIPGLDLKGRCKNYDQSKSPVVCKFLATNYDEIRHLCGLSTSPRWLHPSTWFAKYNPMDSVPQKVLYRIDDEAFAQDEHWAPEDRETLSRLLSFVYVTSAGIPQWPESSDPSNPPKPSTDPSAPYFLTARQMKYLSSTASVGQVISLPGLPAHIEFETSVVQTSSCSDVLSAMASAGISLAALGGSAKLSAQSNSNAEYRLVYGLFESPLAYMRDTPSLQQAFYFQALHAYLTAYQAPPVKDPALSYIQSARAIIIASALQNQSNVSNGVSGNAQYGIPLLSFGASGSVQGQSDDNVTSQEFHALVGDVSVNNFPNWDATTTYLQTEEPGVAQPAGAPKLDSSTKRASTSLGIGGMPSDLCTPSLWQLESGTKAPSDLRLDGIVPVTGTSDASRGGGPVSPSSPVECTFSLSAGGVSTFSGNLVLIPRPSGIASPLKIPFSITFTSPKLLALAEDPPAAWWYQLAADNSVDKNHLPETTGIKLTCNPPSNAGILATFSSLGPKNEKGEFLELAVAPVGATPPKSCTLSGSVILFEQDGTPLEIAIPK